MRAIATDGVAWSVWVLVTTATLKNAETVEMPFGGVDSHGPKVHSFATWQIRQIDLCGESPRVSRKKWERNRYVATVIQSRSFSNKMFRHQLEVMRTAFAFSRSLIGSVFFAFSSFFPVNILFD